MTNMILLSFSQSTSSPPPFLCDPEANGDDNEKKQEAVAARRWIERALKNRHRAAPLRGLDKTLSSTNIAASSRVDPPTRHCQDKTGDAALASHSPLLPIRGSDTLGRLQSSSSRHLAAQRLTMDGRAVEKVPSKKRN